MCLNKKFRVKVGSFIKMNKTFYLFQWSTGLIGLFFFLLGRHIRKSIKTITGKFILRVIFIYAWLAPGYNSYSETALWIQQLQWHWLLDETVTVRVARGYNSYRETGLWIQQLRWDWLVDTTVTVRLACGYNSYSRTGSWIQQLQSTGTYRRYNSFVPHLLRALYPLSEDAVLVADAVAIAGHGQGGHRVKEAGS